MGEAGAPNTLSVCPSLEERSRLASFNVRAGRYSLLQGAVVRKEAQGHLACPASPAQGRKPVSLPGLCPIEEEEEEEEKVVEESIKGGRRTIVPCSGSSKFLIC